MDSALKSAVEQALERNQLALSDVEFDAEWQSQLERSLRAGKPVGRCGIRVRRTVAACPGHCCRLLLRLLLLTCLTVMVIATVQSRLGDEATAIKKWRTMDEAEDIMLTWSMMMRRLSVWLGIHKSSLVQELALSESDCLIPNPLSPLLPPESSNDTEASASASASVPCCMCSFKLGQSTLRNSTQAQINYMKWTMKQNSFPFLLRNGLEKPVNYEEIHRLFWTNRVEFENFGYNRIVRLHGGKGVSSVTDLFASSKSAPPSSVISWRVMHPEAGRHLRKLVPRPKYVTPHMEIGIVKEIVFFGPGIRSDVADLRVELMRELENAFVIALHGQVMVTLAPQAKCDCSHAAMRTVALQPMQLLHFRNGCHQLYVTPINQDDNATAALYIGSQQ